VLGLRPAILVSKRFPRSSDLPPKVFPFPFLLSATGGALLYFFIPMLKSSPKILLFAGLLALQWPALGDTITLKSGEKFEGKVLEETPTELTIEYRASASIVDRRTVKRDEIASIEKEAPDAAPWEAIKGLKLGANSLPATQYDEVLRPVTGFINSFPASIHLDEAKKIAAAFGEEKKRVDGGEVKIADKWLTKEEAEKERYQINGVIAFNYMRTQAAGGDLIGALNTFQQLEKNLGGAKTYPDAVELAKQVLPTLKGNVERAYKNLQAEAVSRQQAAPQSRPALEAAVKRDEDAGLAAIAAADRAGVKWPMFVPRSSKSLAKIAEKIGPEITRLATVPIAGIRQSIAASDKATSALAAKDLEGANAAAQEAGKLWPTNEVVKRLTTEINEAKKLAVAAAKVEEAPKPVAATPAPVVEKKKVAPVAVATVEAPEEKSFFMSTAGIITIVVVIALILIGLRIFKTMRARQAEEE
jgi:hypothetical protein